MSARIGVGHSLGLVTRGDVHSWATFSPCLTYRYALARLWDSEDPGDTPRPLLVAVCLNPSTATHDVTDHTLEKLCKYARREGSGGLVLGNAFAWRSRHPSDLREAIQRGDDPIGPHNDVVLRLLGHISPAMVLVGGWGSPKWACLRSRLQTVRLMRPGGRTWRCFARNKDGHPQHPLYLPDDAPLLPLVA